MKEVTIKIMAYEIGDIVDVSQVEFNNGKKKSNYGMIIETKESNTDMNYWILSDKKTKLRVPQMYNERMKYAGHVDLTTFEAMCVDENTNTEKR